MHSAQDETTENFYASFTDLLVGVIFIFMLLLMVFALNLKNQTPPRIVTEDIRNNIIREVAARMQKRGMPVAIDLPNGLIRLPESLLFDSGQWQLSENGVATVQGLAQVLSEVLPCAAVATRACNWQRQQVYLDSVLIEGHTDKRPFNGAGGMTNWELSAFRSISVYKTMTATVPALEYGVTNTSSQPILGVSAYGESRPVDPTNLDPNRRIDVRFIMRAPTSN
jgi:flagellar motor protein MotB